MSEVFEGIVSRVPTNSLESAVRNLSSQHSLAVATLPDSISVVYRNDPREASAFADEMDCIAQDISKLFPPVLLVRYDSRSGHRSSQLYVNGQLTKEFGEEDELFVPLNEDGEPITTGPQLRFTQLADDEEYETIQNAIELGLSELGGGNWRDLKQLFGRI